MLASTQISGASHAPVVSVQYVHLAFGQVRALRGVSLSIWPRECIGLVGHNGAGKSTLVNVINGRLTSTSGTVTYPAYSSNPESVKHAGVRCVFQELSLCPNLSGLENILIQFQEVPLRGWRKSAQMSVKNALDLVFPGNAIDPNALVGDLTIAERQMVEIAIAFAVRGKSPALVILDEPTSSLDAAIAKQLLNHVRQFCAKGGAVIFISHMMGEIFDVASRIVVMKDGVVTEDRPTAQFTRQSLVDAMGHVITGGATSRTASSARQFGATVVSLPGGLTARRHEIVGLAGHGQAEALATYYLKHASVWRSSANPEVTFVPGDRGRDGIMPLWSILQNMSLRTLVQFSRRGFVNRQAERRLGDEWLARIGIRTNDLNNPILSLSGGNQQKVLFAKALASNAPIVGDG